MPQKKSNKKETEFIKLPIKYNFPEDIISRFANEMVVQHTKHEFIISFFETEIPLIIGSPEEQIKQAREKENARANCVARIIVSPGRMEAFIKVIENNLQNYRSKFGKDETE